MVHEEICKVQAYKVFVDDEVEEGGDTEKSAGANELRQKIEDVIR